MQDTDQDIITKETPGILSLKPVDELKKEEPKERPSQQPVMTQFQEEIEVVEDIHPDDMFIRPTPKEKKKRVMSEKQKAHLANLHRKQKHKKEERQRAKQAELEAKVMAKLQKKEQKKPVASKVVQKDVSISQSPKVAKRPQRNNDSDDVVPNQMHKFIQFMEQYETYKEKKKMDAKPSSPKATSPKPKPKRKQSDDTIDSYYVDFLGAQVGYNNYQNPFGC